MRPLRTILLALAALAATALGGAPARAASRLIVFGDSYSIPVHDGTRDWPLLLRDRGLVGRIDDFARFGATASSGWHINFAQQLQRWRASRPAARDDGGLPRLQRHRRRHGPVPGRLPRPAIDELVAAGATSGGNRLLLVEPHDVGSTPLYNRTAKRGFLRRQTEDWDGFVAFTAHHVARDAGGRVRGDRPGAGAPGPVRVHERDHGRPRARGDARRSTRRVPRRPARAGDHRRHDRRPAALAGRRPCPPLSGQGKAAPREAARAWSEGVTYRPRWAWIRRPAGRATRLFLSRRVGRESAPAGDREPIGSSRTSSLFGAVSHGPAAHASRSPATVRASRRAPPPRPRLLPAQAPGVGLRRLPGWRTSAARSTPSGADALDRPPHRAGPAVPEAGLAQLDLVVRRGLRDAPHGAPASTGTRSPSSVTSTTRSVPGVRAT